MKVSRFTPSLMKHEDLEEIFVQRHKLAKNIVELIRESAITPSKHHTLLIGPRGIGKTHLVSLVYHRIREMDDLGDRLLIAWLREEEWGITSFLDLLLRIFRALQEESEGRGAQLCAPTERVELLYELPPDDAERAGAELLKEVIGERTLLLLMENLDEIFAGLGDEGQKRLRAFLQENACCTILATSQSLFNGVKVQTSPFYGFFRIHHLEALTSEDATQLLANIARLEGDRELESFIQMPTGRDRIRAVHHLAGGSHRVYVIFSEFLTRESLDELVEAFMQTLDDLTPYYQSRMTYLSPQQRKIIEFLCDRRHAVPVKDIAQYCFISHQTASSQLKKLLEMGYVRSYPEGRESFYELREVLMRFCLEVKKQRGEPIRLFVDFLRLWYTRTELQQRLGLDVSETRNEQASDCLGQHLSVGQIDKLPDQQNYFKNHLRLEPLPPDAVLEREYLLYALRTIEEDDEDRRVAASFKEYEDCIEKRDYIHALQLAQKLVAIRGHAQDWLNQGYCLSNLKRYEEALVPFDKGIALEPSNAVAWNNRGAALQNLKRYEEALASCDKAIELAPNYAAVWNNRGVVLQNLKRYEEALASCDKAIELDPNSALAWHNRGGVLINLGRYEEALASCNKAIELDPNLALAWHNRGSVLNNLGRWEEALTSFDKGIEIDRNSALAWHNRGTALKNLKYYEEALISYDKAIEINPNIDAIAWHNRGTVLENLKDYEEALVSYDKAIELNPNDLIAWNKRGVVLGNGRYWSEALESFDQEITIDPNLALAWSNRGWVLDNLGRWEEALASCNKAIELDPNLALAWNNRGSGLNNLGRYEEALASCNKAIELDPNLALAWNNRGGVLNNLGRWEEALASFDKGIEFQEKSINIFFRRAEALLAQNLWNEGIKALDDAFDRDFHSKRRQAGNTGAILRNLIKNIPRDVMWWQRAMSLRSLYHKYGLLSALGQGLVQSIPELMSPIVSDAATQLWRDIWHKIAWDLFEFQIPLRLLNTAVRYREKKGDKRVLLELPIEERELLKPLLESEKN